MGYGLYDDSPSPPFWNAKEVKRRRKIRKKLARQVEYSVAKPAQGITREAMAQSWIEDARKRRRGTYNEPT